MFNGQKIKQLLEERGLQAKALLAYLGVKDNGSIARFLGPDIKASRLEQIADFFGLSIDTFFIRNIEVQGGQTPDSAPLASVRFSSKVRELTSQVKMLEAQCQALSDLVKEKDERIKLFEKIVNNFMPK